jgi:hypothetical protein
LLTDFGIASFGTALGIAFGAGFGAIFGIGLAGGDSGTGLRINGPGGELIVGSG